MAVLQEYYTSADGKGFHVKATSPGITMDIQKTIDRLIDYRVPSSLDARAIETHPTALRYWYNALKPEQSVLLCSRSAASDETNRAGNIFAHSLVMEPTTFSSIPPIFYWHSPIWQRSDPVHRAFIESLPTLDATTLDMLDISFEDMWAFLARGERRLWLYKLLSAVVLAPKTKRRIVIIDEIENVSWWIKLVSLLLPPDYRPLLSFSTYSHEIALSPFLITGTTSDWFRDTEREYLTYFVLNAVQGRYSNVEDSFYAREAVDAATPTTFEDKLLKLLTDCTLRFAPPLAIDLQFDVRMRYARIQQGQDTGKPGEGELQAIHLALNAFDKISFFTSTEIAELKRLKIVLEEAEEYAPSQALRDDYQHVCDLLKQHEQEIQPLAEYTPEENFRPFQEEGLAPTQIGQQEEAAIGAQNGYTSPNDQNEVSGQYSLHSSLSDNSSQGIVSMSALPSSLMKNVAHDAAVLQSKLNGQAGADPEADQHFLDEPKSLPTAVDTHIQEKLKEFISTFDPKKNPEENEQRYRELTLLGDTVLTAQVSHADFIGWLLKAWEGFLEKSRYPFLLHFWEFLGCYLKPATETWPVLHMGLSEVDRLEKQDIEEDDVNAQKGMTSEAKSDALFEAIITGILHGKQQWGWLKLVIEHSTGVNDVLAQAIYGRCIEIFPLDQRPPFRRNFGPKIFANELDALGYELAIDLEQAKKQNLRLSYSKLEDWVRYIKQGYDKGTVEAVKEIGLNLLKQKCNTQQWRELARPILMSTILAPLPQEIEIEVVRVVLPALSLARFEDADVPFCRKYMTADIFGEDTRTTLSAIVAMKDGSMDEALMQRIQRQVKMLLPNEYEPGVQHFIAEFFKKEITPVAHAQMINAFFTRNFNYNTHFWKAYHDAWLPVFLDQATTVRAANLLNFWFDTSSTQLLDQPDIFQEFLLVLPELMTSVRKTLTGDALHKAMSIVKKYAWYAEVKKYFS